MTDVSGLYPLSKVIANEIYVKMLLREVLLDRYRTTLEQFQYQGVEVYMTFRVFTPISNVKVAYSVRNIPVSNIGALPPVAYRNVEVQVKRCMPVPFNQIRLD